MELFIFDLNKVFFSFYKFIENVVPEDVTCQSLAPLIYAKCGGEKVDNSVTRALQQLTESLEEVGE